MVRVAIAPHEMKSRSPWNSYADVHLLPNAHGLWSRSVLIEVSLIIAGAALIGVIVAAAMNG